MKNPVITKTYYDQTVVVGENVTFVCETPNEPPPNFLFYKLNLNMLVNNDDSVLNNPEFALHLQDTVSKLLYFYDIKH